MDTPATPPTPRPFNSYLGVISVLVLLALTMLPWWFTILSVIIYAVLSNTTKATENTVRCLIATFWGLFFTQLAGFLLGTRMTDLLKFGTDANGNWTIATFSTTSGTIFLLVAGVVFLISSITWDLKTVSIKWRVAFIILFLAMASGMVWSNKTPAGRAWYAGAKATTDSYALASANTQQRTARSMASISVRIPKGYSDEIVAYDAAETTTELTLTIITDKPRQEILVAKANDWDVLKTLVYRVAGDPTNQEYYTITNRRNRSTLFISASECRRLNESASANVVYADHAIINPPDSTLTIDFSSGKKLPDWSDWIIRDVSLVATNDESDLLWFKLIAAHNPADIRYIRQDERTRLEELQKVVDKTPRSRNEKLHQLAAQRKSDEAAEHVAGDSYMDYNEWPTYRLKKSRVALLDQSKEYVYDPNNSQLGPEPILEFRSESEFRGKLDASGNQIFLAGDQMVQVYNKDFGTKPGLPAAYAYVAFDSPDGTGWITGWIPTTAIERNRLEPIRSWQQSTDVPRGVLKTQEVYLQPGQEAVLSSRPPEGNNDMQIQLNFTALPAEVELNGNRVIAYHDQPVHLPTAMPPGQSTELRVRLFDDARVKGATGPTAGTVRLSWIKK